MLMLKNFSLIEQVKIVAKTTLVKNTLIVSRNVAIVNIKKDDDKKVFEKGTLSFSIPNIKSFTTGLDELQITNEENNDDADDTVLLVSHRIYGTQMIF